MVNLMVSSFGCTVYSLLKGRSFDSLSFFFKMISADMADEIDLIRSEALDMMRHDGSWEQKQEETTNKMRSSSREMGSLPKPFRRSQQEHRELTKIVNS